MRKLVSLLAVLVGIALLGGCVAGSKPAKTTITGQTAEIASTHDERRQHDKDVTLTVESAPTPAPVYNIFVIMPKKDEQK